MACTDPGVFVRGGRFRSDGENTALKTFLFVFLRPQLVLQFTEGSNGCITEKTLYFSKESEGVQQFPGVGPKC